MADIHDLTDKHTKIKNALRQQAVTEHTDIGGELALVSNNVLRSLGEQIGKADSALSHARYLGSAAVHIYELPTLGTQFFSVQVETLAGVPEILASSSFTMLQNEMLKRYGRKERRSLPTDSGGKGKGV